MIVPQDCTVEIKAHIHQALREPKHYIRVSVTSKELGGLEVSRDVRSNPLVLAWRLRRAKKKLLRSIAKIKKYKLKHA